MSCSILDSTYENVSLAIFIFSPYPPLPLRRFFFSLIFCFVWSTPTKSRWRTYVREPSAPRPRTLDTALLLCEGHGLLLPPPHVEEFLSGERRALLGGLDSRRSGCVCEVLTPEEWDALTLVSDSIGSKCLWILFFGLLVCWFVGLLVCWFVGLFVGFLVCWSNCLFVFYLLARLFV